MNGGLGNLMIALPLSVAAMVAAWLTLARGGVQAGEARVRAGRRAAVVAILLQGVHFAEEAATGLHRRLPELFGLEPWPFSAFAGFNLFWFGVWTVSAWSLAQGRWAALFPLWFLGVAGLVNAVAHPSLALRAGGYFPGLLTFPLVALAGVLLLRSLASITGGRDRDHG